MLSNVLKGSILEGTEHPKRGEVSHLSGKGDHPDPGQRMFSEQEGSPCIGTVGTGLVPVIPVSNHVKIFFM